MNLMKKFSSQLPSEINLLNPNLISFMHKAGIFHLPTCVLQICTTEMEGDCETLTLTQLQAD